MSDVTAASGASTASSASSSATATTQQFGEEFNSFIQLLTAQVRHQDPLSPMDSTQFVEQLATFSTLEQQVRSNQSLESIAVMMSDLHAVIASDWLGQKVSVESSWVPYSGAAVEFTADMPEDTDRAVLSVRDSDGNVLHTETLKSKTDTYIWDGETESGETAPDGVYQFSIDLYKDDAYLGTIAPRIITTVTEVASENGTTRFGTSSSLTTDANNVRKEE